MAKSTRVELVLSLGLVLLLLATTTRAFLCDNELPYDLTANRGASAETRWRGGGRGGIHYINRTGDSRGTHCIAGTGGSRDSRGTHCIDGTGGRRGSRDSQHSTK